MRRLADGSNEERIRGGWWGESGSRGVGSGELVSDGWK